MAIAGHVSRKMIEHYSHIRIEAKRVALDAIANPDSTPNLSRKWGRVIPAKCAHHDCLISRVQSTSVKEKPTAAN